jgi:hypothetical protein
LFAGRIFWIGEEYRIGLVLWSYSLHAVLPFLDWEMFIIELSRLG